MRKRLALIGTGISGMACGYFLHRKYDLTVYEQNRYIGGHTNTVSVEEEGREIFIDTGFMVYNEVTYPNFTKLLDGLNVPTRPTTMSFSVQHVPSGLEYCGSGIAGLFAQRQNLINPSFLSMLYQVDRFNRESAEILEKGNYDRCTLREYVADRKYGSDFMEKYLIPMSSAVWSTPREQMMDFPATTLLRFFYNHGFLGLHTQHPWRTIVGGSKTYRDRLIAPFSDRILTGRAARKVWREEKTIRVGDSIGDTREFDAVIFACHADQTLRLLADPTLDESRLLPAFPYQKNIATLHTDTTVMPKTRQAWSSWNYRVTPNGHPESSAASTIYYMNSLQKVSQKRDYFVSINDQGTVRDEKILLQLEYEHPVFHLQAVDAQKELQKLNQSGRTFFCGSYFSNGFHEDGLNAALEVCRKLGVDPWNR
jgi:predicted NAD/FAD-binding protein